MKHPLLPLLLALAFFNSPLAHARDLHATPTGSGTKDGSTWENALDAKSLNSVINERMQPGDRLLLGSGTYQGIELDITKGGSPKQPKSILGVDRGGGLPVLTSNWSVDNPTKGDVALDLAPGVSHLTVQGFRLKGYLVGVNARAVKGQPARSHLTFIDVDMSHLRHGFYLSDCDDLQFTGCDLKRYSKHGFRFDQGCDRVTMQQCTADCSEGDPEWEKKTELFPFGFTVNDGGAPNTSFVFTDCLARNNLMPLQTTKYKNGDGFVVESNTKDVEFIRCLAIRNQDGGFDLKVRDVRLTSCLAIGNSRGFRIWTTATMINCFVGWGGDGLWNNGGPVTLSHCTFHELKHVAVLSDDSATAPITLDNCLISNSAKPHAVSGSGRVILKSTIITEDSKPESDPKYIKPASAWDGLGSAMDSRAYPQKGYRHAGGKPVSP